ncbi:uncharacterized protein LOC133785361 [Humulus lupulus]|uniref:uncharacterized protein LOC133785361 n=1 Tax=Humulus lupulus TaxID=3486 RepID=UPI002B403BB0|nr:uncharacterized protein LOC133785361 [Humulus lupulus]
MVKFSRMLVDVEISDHLPQFINFLNERGQLMVQAIEFEWLPTRCSHCKSFGHLGSSCKRDQGAIWRKKETKTGLGNVEAESNQATTATASEIFPKVPHDQVTGIDIQTGMLKQKCSSNFGQELKWTTQKKVGGAKHIILDTQNLRTNKYIVLQESQMEATKKGQQKINDSNGRVQRAFLETKLRENKIEEMMRSVFVGWDCFNSPVVEGRILLVWKTSQVSLSILQEDEQYVHCSVKIKGITQKFCLTLVYVFDYDDRIGGHPVTELELEDGRHWRVSWVDTFPDSEARFNWDVISDHCYCIIKTVTVQILGARPFKYFNMWADHQELRSTVLQNWSDPSEASGLQRILKKLHRLKSVLLQFNRVKVGDVAKQFSEAKVKYQQAQLYLQQDPHLVSLQLAEKEACVEFGRQSRMYESFLRQRSKITWLRFGDENTSYFHASLKQRKDGNWITSFMDDTGQVNDNYEEVVAYFINHFKGFFGSPSSATTRIEQDCFTQGAVLTLEQQLGLILPFTKNDVKESLFSIHSIKSPDPDGYGSRFFKALWKDIGDEISEAILTFFDRGELPHDLNNTIISLIPKVDTPSKAADYRLLDRVLLVLVRQNQGAFIKNRLFVHNILILQDLLKGYTRKNVSPRCLIKIDLSKAYDYLDWVFWEDLLKSFCFLSRFIQWIMVCLTSIYYTLLMNERLQGGFCGRKGLRQGDLISPLLFVLVMEYLTRLLSHATHNKEFRFHPLCKSLHLVNLCFVDDLILFCKGNLRSIQILSDGFTKFSKDSGLFANLTKSQVYFGGISSEDKKSILTYVNIEEGIRMYWMNIFLLPQSVIHEIDRLCQKFLWGAKGNLNKLHCSSWDQRDSITYAKVVWCKLSVSKHRFILWQTVLGHLLTRDNLLHCHVPMASSLGPVCKSVDESHAHLFFECIFSQKVLKHIRRWLGPALWPDKDTEWILWMDGKPKGMLRRIAADSLAAEVYFIWINRNSCIFDHCSLYVQRIDCMIKLCLKARLFSIMRLNLQVKEKLILEFFRNL